RTASSRKTAGKRGIFHLPREVERATETFDAELMLSAFGSSRFHSPVFAPVQGELHSHRDVTERLLTKAIAIRRSWTCDPPLDSSLRLRRVYAWPQEQYAWQ